MKHLYKIVLLFFCLILTVSVFGETDQTSTPAVPAKPWSATARFGLVDNTGNVSTSNIMGHLKFDYKKNKWLLHIAGGGRLTSDKGEKTGENYTAKGGVEYYFRPRNFSFSEVDCKFDEFSPYLYVVTIVAGYGWKVVDNDKVGLILKAGPGLRRQKESEKKGTEPQEADDDLIGYGAADFTWNITKDSKFTQKVSTDIGPKGIYFRSKTALLTKIIGNLGMELSFEIHHYTKIPRLSENEHKTDTRTQLAFVYSF